ncbi:MAG TPA: heme iron utilization protein [Rhodospirillaceae bacterium]|nr:heme iron utilization protein [Rhodospirillaceae bacterium]
MSTDAPGGVRQLMRNCRKAALATTLAGQARPYVSLVTVAFDMDGSPILLLSQLADHSRNIEADPRVALLFDGTQGHANPQQGPRVTLEGRIEPDPSPPLRRRFLAAHPAAKLYADFADFALYRVKAERAHWVGGFGKAQWFDQGLILAPALAAAFAQAENEILQSINQQQSADLATLAVGQGQPPGLDWQLVAIDPDGCDLVAGKAWQRISFPISLCRPDEVATELAEMAVKK